jgi:signal transduction histidine kinase
MHRVRATSAYCRMNAASTRRALSLSDPEPALHVLALARAGGDLELSEFTLVEMWTLCAAAALARAEQKSPIHVHWNPSSPARGFALAVGFDEVIGGTTGGVEGEAGRTVRLTRVASEEDVHPVATAISELLAGRTHLAAKQTLQYVMTELLRNVIQHSDDHLGAVVGAQLNDRGLHKDRPVFQVAVADTGRGIRASLSRTHTDVDDDKVALERSLWPYVSGAFAPGRVGARRSLR